MHPESLNPGGSTHATNFDDRRDDSPPPLEDHPEVESALIESATEEPDFQATLLQMLNENTWTAPLSDLSSHNDFLAEWVKIKLQFKMSREEFLQVVRLAKMEQSRDLPLSRRKWERVDTKLLSGTHTEPFSIERLSVEIDGVSKSFTVPLFSIWRFAQQAFSKRFHAKVLGSWRARKSRDEVLRDFVDGELFAGAKLRDDRDLRLLIFYDDTNVQHFNAVESDGILRVIPANYPAYIRDDHQLWWTVAAIPTALMRTYSLDYFVARILTELKRYIEDEEQIWDSHRDEYFAMTAAVVAVFGDLKGRNQLFRLPLSFSKLWRWCPLCWATRDDKELGNKPLRSTSDMMEKGEILDSLSDGSVKAGLSKEWGLVGSSAIYACGLLVEHSLDDAMHTIFMGVIVRQWDILFTGFYFTEAMKETANRRCGVYPFTKRQENLTNLASKLPKKARNKMTALAPLVVISRKLFSSNRQCECVVEELDPIVIGTHGLPAKHSVADHFFCFKQFAHAVFLSLRREFPKADLEPLQDMWNDWRDLMLDLQYSQWFHVKEHLLTSHAALTLQRGGPFPFIWSFPNERGHRDFKSALTNNLDDSFQRLKYVHKRFGVELDATNNPELEGIAVTRKGKPQACPQYDRLLAQCCSALGAEQTQSLLQQLSECSIRGLVLVRNCFARFRPSLQAIVSNYPVSSLVARVASILEDPPTHRIFVIARLYLLSGRKDDTIDGTGFPYVRLLPDFVALPAACVLEEVNIVPTDLDFFVQRNQTLGLDARASWQDWEGGAYAGELLVVPT